MIELAHLDRPAVTVNAKYDKGGMMHTCSRWTRKRPLYSRYGVKRPPRPGKHLRPQGAYHSGSVRVGVFESRRLVRGEPGIDLSMSSPTMCAPVRTL